MESKCPFNQGAGVPARSFTPMPERIAALPISDSGYPIPFFVHQKPGDTAPDFRIADPVKQAICIRFGKCWVCGQQLGKFKAFAIGPMCTVNRTTAEPPAHLECALWSVQNCPFLSRPTMKRREDEDSKMYAGNMAGHMIKRNPGVTAIWVTEVYKLFPDGAGRHLIEIGEPSSVSWWREGRQATLLEVSAAIESGLPFLRDMIAQEKPEDRAEAEADLVAAIQRAAAYLPRAEA